MYENCAGVNVMTGSRRPIFTFYVIYSSLTDDWHCDQYRWCSSASEKGATSKIILSHVTNVASHKSHKKVFN